MPFVLEPDLPRLLLLCSPRAALPAWSGRASIARGGAEKFLGEAPLRIGDRPVPLVPRRERGRGAAAQAARRASWRGGGRAGTSSISTTTHDRPGRGPADLPRPGHLLRPARLQLGDAAGRGPGPADGPGPGRAGALAEPDLGGEAVRGAGWRSSTAGSAPAATAAIASSAGRSGPTLRRLDAVAAQNEEYAARFVDLGVPERAGQRHRLGQVRRPGERPEQRRGRSRCAGSWGSSPADLVFVAGSTMEGEEAAALAAYRAARRRAPAAPADPGPPPRRAVRAGRRLAASGTGRRCVRRSRPETAAPSGRRPRRRSS